MNFPKVSIIIVTYNSASYINLCLDSVLNITYPNYEVIIVDNNSQDKTKEIMNKFKNKIKIFNTGKNLGYAEGNNFGFNKSNGKYIFFLNPDTIVDKNFMEPLISSIKKNQLIGACQPLVRLMKKRNKINLTGKITHYLGFDWISGYLKKIPLKSGEIYSFSGCGILLSKKVFEDVGQFDPSFFTYYEDTDLSWRMRLKGYNIRFVPSSIIFHDYKYIPEENYQPLKLKLYYCERNRLITILKNYTLKTLIIISPMLIFMELSMIVYSLSAGWFKEKMKGYWSIIHLKNEISRKRKFIQANRVISDKEIISHFVQKLNNEVFNHFAVKIINLFLSWYWNMAKYLI